MCAMIPMFRVRSSEMSPALVDRVAVWVVVIGLPLEVAEGAVRLRHPMRVLAALHRGTEAVAGVDQLRGELVRHALAVPPAGRLDEPAHAEADPAVSADLDRDLVGRATDALRLDLDERHGVAQGGLEHLDAGTARLALAAREGILQDAVRQLPLAAVHELVRELIERAVPVSC